MDRGCTLRQLLGRLAHGLLSPAPMHRVGALSSGWSSPDQFASPERLTLLLRAAQILVIDDEEGNVLLVSRLLARAGFGSVVGLQDARKLESQIARSMPDLVITDLHMPHRDGFSVIEALQPWIADSRLPILVVSGDAAVESRNRALSLGARDFVSKPFDPTELALRVRNQLETRLLFHDVRKQNRALREAVHGRTQELEGARIEMLSRLATAAEYRDDCTAQHTVRVAALAARLADALGLRRDEVEDIRSAAPLHDVGKIGVPDDLLRKPGNLSQEEVDLMRTHTTMGADILRDSPVRVLQVAREIALTHHERWDGAGYPRGLAGDDIPLCGRIVAVADAYDAITNDRPYRAARSVQEAIEEIVRHSGSQFDPTVVNALLRIAAAGLLDRSERAAVSTAVSA